MVFDIRGHKRGCTLRLVVRPGAGRTEILGEYGEALRLAVAAQPEKGKANREALRFLAKTLSLSRADVEIVGGETSREKVVLFHDVKPEELAARLGEMLSD